MLEVLYFRFVLIRSFPAARVHAFVLIGSCIQPPVGADDPLIQAALEQINEDADSADGDDQKTE